MRPAGSRFGDADRSASTDAPSGRRGRTRTVASLSRAIAALGATLAAVVACTSSPAQDPSDSATPPPAAAPWFAVNDAPDIGGAGIDVVADVPTARRTLLSPHVSLRVTRAGFVNSISSLAATHLSRTRLAHTTPPAGQQILIVTVDSSAAVFARGGHPQVTVLLGTTEHDITATVAYHATGGSSQTTVITGSVAKNAAAQIRVRDEGRTAIFDLRKRTSSSPFAAPRQRTLHPSPDQLRATSVVGHDLFRAKVTVTYSYQTLRIVRLAWAPGLGWARTGRSWLALTDFQISDDAVLANVPDIEGLVFLPSAGSFQLRVGERLVPARGELESAGQTPRFDGQSVYLDVPTTLRTATLLIRIDGRFTATKGTATWRNSASPRRVPLTLP